eukprot:11161927-Lingulodinium_polyedra.AAC.1
MVRHSWHSETKEPRGPPLAIPPHPWRGAIVKRGQSVRGTRGVECLGKVERSKPSIGCGELVGQTECIKSIDR